MLFADKKRKKGYQKMDLFIILMLLTGIWIFITSLLHNFEDSEGNYPFRGIFSKFAKDLLVAFLNDYKKRINANYTTSDFIQENQKEENINLQQQEAYTETNIQEMFKEKFQQAIVKKQEEVKILEQKLKQEKENTQENQPIKNEEKIVSNEDSIIDLSNILI